MMRTLISLVAIVTCATACGKKLNLDNVPPAPMDPSAPVPEPPLPDASGARDRSTGYSIGPGGFVTPPKTPWVTPPKTP